MPKCLPFWLPDGLQKHEVWRHYGQSCLSQGWVPGRTSWQRRRTQEKNPGSGAGNWSSHFNSSYCMTLNQPSLWLRLSFPRWTMSWLDQLISQGLTALTPCTQGPKRLLASLRKDNTLRLKHQGRVFLLGHKQIRPETLPLRPWGWQGRWPDHPGGKPTMFSYDVSNIS